MTNNLVRLIGYVGKDLTPITATTGNRRLHLRVATHFYTKQNDGTKINHTVWHDVIAWGPTAEYGERTFVKGSKIMVEGALEYRTFPDQSGHLRYTARIAATSLLNLDR